MSDHPKQLQLHFENPANLQETRFVVQRGICTPDELREWISEARKTNDKYMPPGWSYVVMNERDPRFVWTSLKQFMEHDKQ